MILDPFMGLGTSLNKAADMGLSATGLDSNPLACLAAKAKLYGIGPVNQLKEFVNELSGHLEKNNHNNSYYLSKKLKTILTEPKYDYTRKWFREDTFFALLNLFLKIAEYKNVNGQRLLLWPHLK